MATTYSPIGRVYTVKFLDDRGYSWEQNVAIPFDADVTECLAILSQAYPGRKVCELKEREYIHHGYIGQQVYGGQEKVEPAIRMNHERA